MTGFTTSPMVAVLLKNTCDVNEPDLYGGGTKHACKAAWTRTSGRTKAQAGEGAGANVNEH